MLEWGGQETFSGTRLGLGTNENSVIHGVKEIRR